jgi:DNA mismatch endonuclease (patch repair protein)
MNRIGFDSGFLCEFRWLMPSDHLVPEQRSRNMAKVRSRDSLIEMRVRKALHGAGFRYVLHARHLPGKPDIVLPKYRTVVFVHGCFWHGHGCRRSKRPTTNRAFWDRKLDRNIARDAANRQDLEDAYWTVQIIWQCHLDEELPKLILQLKELRAAR